MLHFFPDKRSVAKKLLNHPFLQKYFGDFTDLNLKIFENYIIYGYICFNIINIDEINTIINQYIFKKSKIKLYLF